LNSTEKPLNAEEALWDVADVASYMRVSKSWVYQATASARFPCVRIGALLRFEPETVRAWVRGETGAARIIQLPGCR
jgi:excisionase family DNA binding protein